MVTRVLVLTDYIKSTRCCINSDTSWMTQRGVGEGERAQFSGVYIEDRDGVG